MIKRYIVIGVFFVGIILSIVLYPKNRIGTFSPVLPVSVFHGTGPSINIESTWSLVATGDIIPARSVNYKTLVQHDFTWSWNHIAPILKLADIAVINLEAPLLANCPVVNDGFTFCGDERHVEGLVYAGVDVATLANNHIGNYGKTGIRETAQLLRSNGIAVAGIDEEPPIRMVQDVRVGFLAYNDIGTKEDGVSWTDVGVMQKEIQALRNDVDVLVVSMSWGEEYTATPSGRQKELAHLIIESGADLILGNHPHWIQPPEIYHGKYIMYAHGNTIFDQMWSEETKIGVIGIYTFSGARLRSVEFIPTYIINYGQPILLTDKKRQEILDALAGVESVIDRY